MATYAPPSETLTLFNPDVFLTNDAGDFLAFPVAQGAEVFPFGLTTSTATVAGALSTDTTIGTAVGTAVSLYNEATRTGAISIGTGGTSTRTTTIGFQASGNTLNLNGGAINIQGSGGLTTTISNTGILSLSNGNSSAINIGSTKTGGQIDIGQSGGTASTTTINIGTGTLNTGAISIGTGNTTGSLPITIGNQTGSFGSVDIGSTTISIGKANCATNNIGTSTGGTLNLKTAASSGGAINMGTGMTSGTISIGSGTGDKTITIGNTAGANILNLTSNTVNLQTATGSVLIGTTATAGVITIGGSSSNSLSIQRPIQLSSGADPASNTSAIGYILTNVTGGVGGAISVPVNKYTWSTGVMSLPIGVYMLSLYAEYVAAASVTAFNFNMGFMSSAPTTGDSATASSAPTNTISGINGNERSDDNSNLTNGTYINQIGGVVVNNYGGTYNNVYGIFNGDWITSGTITMSALTIRAVKIG